MPSLEQCTDCLSDSYVESELLDKRHHASRSVATFLVPAVIIADLLSTLQLIHETGPFLFSLRRATTKERLNVRFWDADVRVFPTCN